MFLANMTWPEAHAAFAAGAVALLPVGATEAHGPHLPLDTDVRLSEGVARRAAAMLEASGTPALVLPSLAYGVSYVGTSFAGTLPVAPETMTLLVRDVLVALDLGGCTRAAVVNSHLEPAHVEALKAGIAAATVATDARLRIAFADQREPQHAAALSAEFRRGARHAGGYETSLMLADFPGSVRDDYHTLPPVWVDLPARLRAGARTFAEAGGTEGYFGDPATATAAEGVTLFDTLARIVVESVQRLTPAPFDAQ